MGRMKQNCVVALHGDSMKKIREKELRQNEKKNHAIRHCEKVA